MTLISRRSSEFAPACIWRGVFVAAIHFLNSRKARRAVAPCCNVALRFTSNQCICLSAVIQPRIPLNSHHVEERSSISPSTGDSPCWIFSTVRPPICIASVQLAPPCPSLRAPSEESIAVPSDSESRSTVV
jgi:hypothetical protein